MKAPSFPQLAFALWALLLIGNEVTALSTSMSAQEELTDTTFPNSRYERFQAQNQANDDYTTAEARSLFQDTPDTHQIEGNCDLKSLSFDPPYISSEAIAIVCSTSDDHSALKRSILNCLESKFGNVEVAFHVAERHCSHVSDDPFRHSLVTSPSTWLHPPSLCLVCVVLGLALWVWSVRKHSRNGEHDCIERQLTPEKEDQVHAKDIH